MYILYILVVKVYFMSSTVTNTELTRCVCSDSQ